MQPLSIRSFPQAILHIDADAFFASCEQATHPELKGRPVVTGKERGIASAASYEAKARGVKRGQRLDEVRRVCPDVAIVPSDYETYSAFSRRMFAIIRRYTPEVEEYSIDECFADITGMRRPLKMSYSDIVARVKHDIETELGISVSVGLAPTKTLAKIASNWDKPSGAVLIPGYRIHEFLAELPLSEIWGIGPQTSSYAAKHRVYTGLDFACREKAWVDAHFAKPYQESWQELRGVSIYPVMPGEKETYTSISKTKTFTPPSSDRAYVFAQLSKNIENACIKLRRHTLATKRATFFLKRQDFGVRGIEVKMLKHTATPHEIIAAATSVFDTLWRDRVSYRASGVIFSDLSSGAYTQLDLFAQNGIAEKETVIYEHIDALRAKFGKHTVFLGSSLAAHAPAHRGDRGDTPDRQKMRFKGETARRRLRVPYIGDVN